MNLNSSAILSPSSSSPYAGMSDADAYNAWNAAGQPKTPGFGKFGPYGNWAPPGSIRQETKTGGFGYEFGDPQEFGADKYGVPKAAMGMFPQAAGYLLQGSERAAASGVRGFEAGYRARAQGVAAGFNEQQNRVGGEVASQGYSPDLVRRMLFGQEAQTQAQIGTARAEADQGQHQFLAELQKNTGVELAGLKRDQINVLIQAYLAKKARTAGTQAGALQLAGSALGAGALAFGGPAAGAGTQFVSSQGGKIF